VPAAFTDSLLARLDERAEERDLILYGVVPVEETAASAASGTVLGCHPP
jgi:hypothetical protein